MRAVSLFMLFYLSNGIEVHLALVRVYQLLNPLLCLVLYFVFYCISAVLRDRLLVFIVNVLSSGFFIVLYTM